MENLSTWLSHDTENVTDSTIIDGEISRFPKLLRTFAAVVAILIMIIGLAGNLLTIVALCKYPKVRNVAAAFIISLCVADFVFCILVLPFDSIRFIDPRWTDVRFLCVFVPFLRYGNVGVSLLSVAAITINSLKECKRPGQSKQLQDEDLVYLLPDNLCQTQLALALGVT
ncbi:hypothetical protein KM043_016481 [Ampulex compressa]|nr:hypothetical protein KM043_016481 [Ampulex compressa]